MLAGWRARGARSGLRFTRRVARLARAGAGRSLGLGTDWPLSPVLQKSKLKLLPPRAEHEDSTKFVALTLLSVAAITGVLLASGVIYCLRHSSHSRLKEKLAGLAGDPGPDATAAYQVKEAVLSTRRSRASGEQTGAFTGPWPLPQPRTSHSARFRVLYGHSLKLCNINSACTAGCTSGVLIRNGGGVSVLSLPLATRDEKCQRGETLWL